jgi:hypothetical protein
MATGVFGLNKIYKKQTDNIRERNFSQWPESAVYGYSVGGYNGTTFSTVNRLDFSSETVSAPGKNLAIARYVTSSLSSAFHGYVCGGANNPPITYRAEVERLDYSNDTMSSPGKNLYDDAYNSSAISGTDYGYITGGTSFVPRPLPQGGPYLINLSNTFRLDFYSETVQDNGKPMTYATEGFVNVTDFSDYGYVAGGNNRTNISRLDFSNEVYTLRSSNLSLGRSGARGVSSQSYGYFAGGTTPALISTITRLDFSNETVSDPGNNLPTVIRQMSEFSNFSYGYFSGGNTGSYVNTVTRLDFSNETVSAPGNNLTYSSSEGSGLSGGASVLPS